MNNVCLLVQNHYDMDIRVRRKAEALVAAGYSVDVLALASSDSSSATYELNGVNVYALSLSKKRGSLVRYAFEYFAFLFWAFWKLSVLMEKRRYKVVDVNTLPDFLIFAGLYAKLRGAKLLLDMHEITPEFYMSKYGKSEQSISIRVHKLIEWMSMKFADHVLTINEPINKLLQGRGLKASKSTVIMNAVDDALFASAVCTDAPEVEGANASFVMMYHGTLTHIYGLDISISAFGKVHQQMPGAEFWILGGGTEKKALEALVQKLGLNGKVKFIGNVLPQAVPQWLKRCDVGVLATRRDVFLDFSFSNKISEYIIMGKGVVASRLKAIRHYYSEDAFAFFEPNDADALSKQMVRVYGDSEFRAKLVAKAKQEYAPICWDVMKARYLNLMARLGGEVPVAAQAPSPVADAAAN